MSSKGTSSPVEASTRFCLMRAPVLAESWWKRTALGEVAVYSFTGTLTSPKLIAPDQIARAMSGLYSEHGVLSSYDGVLARKSSVGTGWRMRHPAGGCMHPPGRGRMRPLVNGDSPLAE